MLELHDTVRRIGPLLAWLAALSALSFGCDRVFQLDDVHPLPRDTGIDSDAPLMSDVMPCAAGMSHNEDHDAYYDECDLCPTVSGDNSDGDHDMVGDLCDPSPGSPGDRIAVFLPFNTSDGFSKNAAAQLGLDVLMLADSGKVTTTASLTRPQKIVVDFDQPTTLIGDGALTLSAGSASCELRNGSCGSASANTCMIIRVGNVDVATSFLLLDPLQSLSLLQQTQNVECSINGSLVQSSAATGVLDPGMVSVTFKNSQNAIISLTSLIAYDRP